MYTSKLTALNKPYKIYAEAVESSALAQFEEAMEQDCCVQGVLLPDVHTGYTLPIGCVVACEGVVFPQYVGFDIGCGMCAIRTTFDAEEVERNSENIFRSIYRVVPVGFEVHQNPQLCDLDPDNLSKVGRTAFGGRKGFRGLGTLGGGNHFIEIGKDENNRVWVVIHSGSRGVGHGIATEHIRLADPDGKVKDGHHGFRVDSGEGQDYINDLRWALEYALINRKRMIGSVTYAIGKYCKGDLDFDSLINRNHNHAEEKDGLWIHRKGATHAEEGMMGVVPGNMRDGSFIVRGKGNPDSLYSSSHGAGRVMGRKQAKASLDLDEFKNTMFGVTAKVGSETLDESPMAYKDIFEVMRLQTDLVGTIHHITPIINVKG